jgi:hypothetical protein
MGDHQPFVVRGSPFVVQGSSFAVRRSSFGSTFVVHPLRDRRWRTVE